MCTVQDTYDNKWLEHSKSSCCTHISVSIYFGSTWLTAELPSGQSSRASRGHPCVNFSSRPVWGKKQNSEIKSGSLTNQIKLPFTPGVTLNSFFQPGYFNRVPSLVCETGPVRARNIQEKAGIRVTGATSASFWHCWNGAHVGHRRPSPSRLKDGGTNDGDKDPPSLSAEAIPRPPRYRAKEAGHRPPDWRRRCNIKRVKFSNSALESPSQITRKLTETPSI